MGSEIIEVLSKRHDEWIKIAKSFKISDDDANEIVQEMYFYANSQSPDSGPYGKIE